MILKKNPLTSINDILRIWVWCLCMRSVVSILSFYLSIYPRKPEQFPLQHINALRQPMRNERNVTRSCERLHPITFKGGLKSCLAQISSQTCSQYFLRGRAGSPWVSVAARMWIMVVLMWLHASVQIMSSTFHKIMVRFASSDLLLPVPNRVLPTWNEFSWSKSMFVHICATGAVVTYQQVFLCLHICLSVHRSLSLFSCLRLAPPTPLVSPRWPWDAAGNKKALEWQKPAGVQRFGGEKSCSLPVSPSELRGSRQILTSHFVKLC